MSEKYTGGELVAAEIVARLVADEVHSEAVMPRLIKSLDIDLTLLAEGDIPEGMSFPQDLEFGSEFSGVKSHPRGFEIFISDMLLSSAGVGGLEPYAHEWAKGIAAKIDSSILAETSDFITSSGTTNEPMTEATFLDALYRLEEANAQQPFACVLHPKQISDLRASIISTSGTVWSGASAAGGDAGAFASLYGVDMFKSVNCPTINMEIDRQGVMMPLGNQSGLACVFKASIEMGEIKRNKFRKGTDIVIHAIYNDECVNPEPTGGVAIFSKA